MGLLIIIRQQTGNYTRPASREARCRAAVTPQPSCFPSSTPAPYGRGVGCRGSPPAASRRACRPTAVCARRQTGNHTRPASREACCRTAVTPQPSRFPSSTPAPYGRGVGCRGTPPAASREARRRAAALGTKASGTRGPLPSVPKAPYLSV